MRARVGYTPALVNPLGTPAAIPPLPTAPAAPTLSSRTSSSITVVTDSRTRRVYYKRGSTVTGSDDFVATASGGNVTVTGLIPGVQYAFAAVAIGVSGQSALSGVLTASTTGVPVPSTPTSVTVGTTSIKVSSSNDADRIYYKAGTTVAKTDSYVSADSSGDATVTGLTPGTQYAFAATAIESGTESALSSVLTATTSALAVPSTPTLVSKTTTSIKVSSSNNADRIYYKAGSTVGSSDSYVATDSSGDANVTELASNTLYAFAAAVVEGSHVGTLSGVLTVRTNVAANPAPSPPSTPSVSSRTSSSITLRLGDGTHRVYYKAGSSVGLNDSYVSTSGSSVTISNLNSNTTYAFRARGYASGQWSGLSGTLTATTLDPAQAPSAPSAPSVTSKTHNSVTLSLGSGTDRVYYKAGTSVSTSDSYVSTTGSSVTVTGLNANTQYAFAARAYDNGLWSVLSSVRTTTTNTAPQAPTETPTSPNTFGCDYFPGGTIGFGRDEYLNSKGYTVQVYAKLGTTVSKTNYDRTASFTPRVNSCYAMSGLPSGNYAVAVAWKNSAGIGPLSSITNIAA